MHFFLFVNFSHSYFILHNPCPRLSKRVQNLSLKKGRSLFTLKKFILLSSKRANISIIRNIYFSLFVKNCYFQTFQFQRLKAENARVYTPLASPDMNNQTCESHPENIKQGDLHPCRVKSIFGVYIFYSGHSLDLTRALISPDQKIQICGGWGLKMVVVRNKKKLGTYGPCEFRKRDSVLEMASKICCYQIWDSQVPICI